MSFPEITALTSLLLGNGFSPLRCLLLLTSMLLSLLQIEAAQLAVLLPPGSPRISHTKPFCSSRLVRPIITTRRCCN